MTYLPEHYPILVVDDHPTNRQVLQFLLSKMGLDSEVAASGPEAVKLATGNTYGAILMDIMMPGMDGYQATELIRSSEFASGRHTPIIAVTALDLSNAREKCLAAGMDDFITKPISRDVLRDRMERWLQQPVAQLLTSFKRNLYHEGSDRPINYERLRLLYGTDQLGDLLKVFLSATEALLAELKSGIRQRSAEQTTRVAHELKGSAFAVSAEEMASLAKEIEKAAKAGDWKATLAIYAKLAIAFANVEVDLASETRARD